jgi:uncharacterized Zn ribbon protein|tara:strand:- start:370 stop:624 length:255 start_codon:yes stop_codon:yes gene_type:complete
MYDINKKLLHKGSRVKVIKEIRYHGGPNIKVGTIGTIQNYCDPDQRTGHRDLEVKSNIIKNGFIISGNYLANIDEAPDFFKPNN